MLFGWKDEYGTGVAKIDEQHKKLFEIAGKTYSLLNDEFAIDKYDRIIELINELREYAIFHFKFEEEYMLSIGYKKFFSHKVEHDDFIEKINNVDYAQLDKEQDVYLRHILEFVVEWISNHILKLDKKILQFSDK
ncbi:MAG: bacteriohemerythrin [Zhaonellaceae bacterium]|jgi:hemerythrin|nr:hemerythrin family protein [Clostridia bacterium]